MLFSKKRKQLHSAAIPPRTPLYPQPTPPPPPGPYINSLPAPSSPPSYLSPHLPGTPPPRGPSPRPYPANQGWSESQPSFHFKPGAILTSQSYLPLRSHHTGNSSKTDLKWNSCTSIPNMLVSQAHLVKQEVDGWQQMTNDYLNQGAALVDQITDKFNTVITLIDGENFSGDEKELVVYYNPNVAIRGGGAAGTRAISRGANAAATTAITSSQSANYFAKVNNYSNSRLPPNLPPLRLYIPTYPLLCLAASYSQRVYVKPSGSERETHIDADWRMGTKAMVIKSVPIDNMNTVVFAIRGSQTFMDWAVNLNSAPVPPVDFLDDHGNLCHAGFLSVARKMIKPVAARLRHMLEENPNRTTCSLIITGHSAGGAVASLLYAHMMAKEVNSEMNYLTSCFKRVHCITFGAPPVSLLPLQKPTSRQYRKSLFLSFINEGDPVPRADKSYIRSLIDLYAAPPPGQPCIVQQLIQTPPKLGMFGRRPKEPKRKSGSVAPEKKGHFWKIPPTSLSNAGRLVLLRSLHQEHEKQIVACVTTDEELRKVVFGDPMKHMMKLYASRIETLATNAVLAKGWN